MACYLRFPLVEGIKIAVGKNADLVVIEGDPGSHISDIENVEIVFKDSVGCHSQKLIDSAKGRYGRY